MPSYEYKCKVCTLSWDLLATIEEYSTFDGYKFCPYCGAEGNIIRVMSFHHNRGMQEHFNSSTGTIVKSEREFKDDLKRKSELASIRTGIEHNFQPVDHSDRKTLGVTMDGLDATYDRRKQLNMPIPDVVRPGYKEK